MFQKVLIAEDHESINFSLQKTLGELGIAHDVKNYVYYCDDALKRIEKALSEGNPYELLITDLSFDDDFPQQKIKDGPTLIEAARAIQPNLKVLVFSIENRASIANNLVNDLKINAFVPKARRDAQDLKLAIEAIVKGKTYLSPNLKRLSNEQASYSFSEYEIAIVSLLADGVPQKNIPFYLQEKNLKPFGLSSVEKKLSGLKTTLNVQSNEQLIAYCKDSKLI
ncbi:helix-turn-helix domain-containing protein [Pedobacter namyangjuensis]|uniref:response regulator transcription factor n=1 Tax=Pedobacter namyangjuensis TaxID=600626 RepID=UPI000DE3F89E|nr:response regulator transcription factor [Pedobacter namyangjuensis]